MMGEFGSEDKKVSEQLQIQKSLLKRPNSVLRERDTDEVGRMLKKMKKSNQETIQHFTKPRPAIDYDNEKWYPKRQHEVNSDGRYVKKNCYGNAKCNNSPISYRVAPNAHVGVRRSAGILKLSSSSSSSVENDVVRDGPIKKEKQKLSFTLENYQSEAERLATRTRVKPFLQHSGTQDPAHCHVVAENWEGSDDDELSRHNPNHSLIASGPMCVAKLERGSQLLMQSNIYRSHHSDGSTKYFRSPTHSLSGSPKTPQCSERFAMEGGLQETESGSFFSNTIHHSADYSTEGTEQRMIIRSNTVVAGTHSATVSRHDPLSLSSATSTDFQSEILVHSLDSEHISSGRTAMHSGDEIETTMPQTSSPSLRQNQLLSSLGTIQHPGTSSNVPPNDDIHVGSTSEPPDWRSLSSQQVSRKISDSDDESFYSVQSHVGTTLTSLDPAKATVMYEERLSEGPKNQHVPDVL